MNIKYVSLFVFTLVIVNSCFGLEFGATDDTFIWGLSGQEDTNWGSLERFSLNTEDAPVPGSESHGLVKFDLSSLQGGEPVQSATLKLTQKDDADNIYYNLFVYKAIVNWNETDVTWNSFCSDDPNGPLSGIEYDSNLLGLADIVWGADFDGTIHEISIPVSVVNDWINNPANNHGFYLEVEVIGATQSAYWVSFWSHESVSNSGPVLELSFIPNECGDEGTVYNIADINQDCYVDLADFAIMAGVWLGCTDPADQSGLCVGWYF